MPQPVTDYLLPEGMDFPHEPRLLPAGPVRPLAEVSGALQVHPDAGVPERSQDAGIGEGRPVFGVAVMVAVEPWAILPPPSTVPYELLFADTATVYVFIANSAVRLKSDVTVMVSVAFVVPLLHFTNL